MNDRNMKLLNLLYQNIKNEMSKLENKLNNKRQRKVNKTNLSTKLMSYNILAKECELLAKAENISLLLNTQNKFLNKEDKFLDKEELLILNEKLENDEILDEIRDIGLKLKQISI